MDSERVLSRRTIARDSQLRLLSDALDRRRLLRRRARMQTEGHPRLAIIPDDEIGIEILCFGLYERRILSLLFDSVLAPLRDRFSQNVALDVGANIGNHTLFMSSRFRQVLAFEPSDVASLLLRANLRLNRAENVEPFTIGLSDLNALKTLAPKEENNLGSNAITTMGIPVEGAEQVELRRGDDVLAGCRDLGRVALVKIDVEGHEIEVLRGLAKTLSAHQPIILFETSNKYGERGSDEILAFLRSVGYHNFYTLVKDLPFPQWRSLASRAAIRAVFGARYILSRMHSFDDRFYNLAIATVSQELD